jgi:hypothetical protein
LNEIGRALGKDHVVIQFLLARSGGIAPAVRRRAPRTLTLAEREDISRGMVPPSSGDCAQVLAQLPKGSRGRLSGSSTCQIEDAQLAPSDKPLIKKSADGRMATEAARLKGDKSSREEKAKTTLTLTGAFR